MVSTPGTTLFFKRITKGWFSNGVEFPTAEHGVIYTCDDIGTGSGSLAFGGDVAGSIEREVVGFS